jgi:hypothetical protein
MVLPFYSVFLKVSTFGGSSHNTVKWRCRAWAPCSDKHRNAGTVWCIATTDGQQYSKALLAPVTKQVKPV